MPQLHATCRVVCVGEAMIMLAAGTGAPLEDVETFRRSVGGAECNVAGGVAGLGIPTGWLSRVGADGFGRHVLRDLERRGVDVGGVEQDPLRPTGLYVKHTAGGRTRMHYYRTGSAAAAMDVSFLDRPAVRDRLAGAELVHTTGITAAISATAAEMLDQLALRRDTLGFSLSVDLNWRPALWRDQDPAPLWRLLRAADVVLVGADEAMLFAGTSDPAQLRELLGPRATIVLKSDAHVALALEPDGRRTEVPALTVDVVEPVGAGDAFAAGYLAATLQGLPMEQRLRSGHLSAATVLAVPEDHAEPPPGAVRQVLLSCTDEQWAGTRVGPDGVAVGGPA
ncbi:PfkB domain protein [Kribbella flavida DSM 17836]|uniref:PfkB domain protein n=1 Tax=Kribbella flavida (strain DSM 17836 / JCM 10339 / NBRC 14399) TaxID=479435 RepID=D2PUB4_KRIFD|nr:sugar kinase [Kribbella flavida]ADB35165.1 PfkB domain protein [Kribbella flavida DSM 17836]